jgi:hypothetical protein
MIWQGRTAAGSARLAAAALVAAAMTGASPAMASAAPCVALTAGQPPSPDPDNNFLNGVAVLSPCDAWAVGDDGGAAPLTLIEHWDGAGWKQVTSPNFPGGAQLAGASAASARQVWAVGDTLSGTAEKALILDWNGTSWQQFKRVNLNPAAQSTQLSAVATSSASNGWAVGQELTGGRRLALALRWNGTAWTQAKTPSPPAGTDANLSGVTVTSPRNAWAVGALQQPNGPAHALILHWTGSTWKKMGAPNPGGAARATFLSAVVATSARNAWAVGRYDAGSATRPLIIHWNGKAWRQVPSPRFAAGFVNLGALAATSARDAWAAGDVDEQHTLILHWNGSSWRRVNSPDIGSKDELDAVGASSPTDVWAVGTFNGAPQALALHCC